MFYFNANVSADLVDILTLQDIYNSLEFEVKPAVIHFMVLQVWRQQFNISYAATSG